MSNNVAPQAKLQFNTRQIIAGSIVMGVGGALALAGAALAGTALVAGFRQRVQQLDVSPTEIAKQHWSAVRHATNAGVNVWLKEQPGVPLQSTGQR